MKIGLWRMAYGKGNCDYSTDPKATASSKMMKTANGVWLMAKATAITARILKPLHHQR
jgi:hypothetical protein